MYWVFYFLGQKLKKKRPHFKNTGTGEYDIESLSSYGGLEVEEEEDLDDEEEEDEKMLEDLEEKQLMGRIEGLEGSKSQMKKIHQHNFIKDL